MRVCNFHAKRREEENQRPTWFSAPRRSTSHQTEEKEAVRRPHSALTLLHSWGGEVRLWRPLIAVLEFAKEGTWSGVTCSRKRQTSGPFNSSLPLSPLLSSAAAALTLLVGFFLLAWELFAACFCDRRGNYVGALVRRSRHKAQILSKLVPQRRVRKRGPRLPSLRTPAKSGSQNGHKDRRPKIPAKWQRGLFLTCMNEAVSCRPQQNGIILLRMKQFQCCVKASKESPNPNGKT